MCFSATSASQTLLVSTVTQHRKPVTLKHPEVFIVTECSSENCHFPTMCEAATWFTNLKCFVFLNRLTDSAPGIHI